MTRSQLIARAAIALYVVYWIAVLFGYVRVDSTDVPDGLFGALRGVAVVLPAFALGWAVGRGWALAGGLVFLLAALLPDHTVVSGNGVDVTLVGVYGISLGDALVLIAVTTPCVIAGIAARRMWSGRRRADEAAADSVSAGPAAAGPAAAGPAAAVSAGPAAPGPVARAGPDPEP